MIILTILLYVVIIIVALIAIILVIPFQYSCSGFKYEKTYLEAKVKWLFGVLKFGFSYDSETGALKEFRVFGIKPSSKENKESSVKKKNTKKQKKSSGKVGISLMKELFKEGLSAFKKVFNKIKPKKFILSAKVGFDDPYNTGVLRAVLSIFHKEIQRYDVKIDTVFDDEVIEGRFLIQGRIVIAELIPIVIKFMFSRPVKNMFKLRKGKKVYAN